MMYAIPIVFVYFYTLVWHVSVISAFFFVPVQIGGRSTSQLMSATKEQF